MQCMQTSGKQRIQDGTQHHHDSDARARVGIEEAQAATVDSDSEVAGPGLLDDWRISRSPGTPEADGDTLAEL